jgi:membrane protein
MPSTTDIMFSPTLRRTFREVNEDRLSMIAAGVTYYILLASFPALGVLVSLYGFFTEPADLATQVQLLAPVLPPGALDIIGKQLADLTHQETAALSITFIVSFLIALWSAISGVKALFEAMNIAYDEEEKRSFVMLNLLALGFTLGAMVVAIAVVIAIGVVPAILAFLHLDGWIDTLARIAPWPIIALLVFGGIVMLYRYGPSRTPPTFAYVRRGAIIATVVWLVASAGFSYYLANFADYNATYGTLGALIGLLVWVWLSVYIVLVGAEYNRERERSRQMAADAKAAKHHKGAKPLTA